VPATQRDRRGYHRVAATNGVGPPSRTDPLHWIEVLLNLRTQLSEAAFNAARADGGAMTLGRQWHLR
jgi:hypothetical protein